MGWGRCCWCLEGYAAPAPGRLRLAMGQWGRRVRMRGRSSAGWPTRGGRSRPAARPRSRVWLRRRRRQRRRCGIPTLGRRLAPAANCPGLGRRWPAGGLLGGRRRWRVGATRWARSPPAACRQGWVRWCACPAEYSPGARRGCPPSGGPRPAPHPRSGLRRRFDLRRYRAQQRRGGRLEAVPRRLSCMITRWPPLHPAPCRLPLRASDPTAPRA